MHSIYNRFSSITTLLSSCLLALVAAISITSLLLAPELDPSNSSLKITSITVNTGRNSLAHYRARNNEHSTVKFNVSADLTPLFTWNTKQLFIYLGAEYTSADGTRNEVVVWDRIVRRKEDALVNVAGKSKYPLKDMAKTFKNVSNAEFSLKYNLMPHVGLLTFGEAARTEKTVSLISSKRFP